MGLRGLQYGRQWKCSNSAKIWAMNLCYHTKCVSGRLYPSMENSMEIIDICFYPFPKEIKIWTKLWLAYVFRPSTSCSAMKSLAGERGLQLLKDLPRKWMPCVILHHLQYCTLLSRTSTGPCPAVLCDQTASTVLWIISYYCDNDDNSSWEAKRFVLAAKALMTNMLLVILTLLSSHPLTLFIILRISWRLFTSILIIQIVF